MFNWVNSKCHEHGAWSTETLPNFKQDKIPNSLTFSALREVTNTRTSPEGNSSIHSQCDVMYEANLAEKRSP